MSPTSVVEAERKYDVDGAAAIPRLEDLPGVANVDKPVENKLEAVYFDTPDLRLASRKITLRRRTGGSDAGWHLKLPADNGDRREHHEALGKDGEGVPKTLQQLVRVYVRDSELVVVARLTTSRTIYRLRSKTGDVLADFSDDQVHAEILSPDQSSQQWREWELELGHGSRKLLDAGQKLMATAAAQPSRYASKLAHALGKRVPETSEHRVRNRKDPAGAVLLAYFDEQVHALIQQDPQVRLDAQDAVHKMRVATRRMRSALATYRTLLKDQDAVRFVRDELKWLAGVLGEARDAEVMHKRLKKMIDNEPSDLVLGPVARRVDIELGGHYKKAHTRVLEELGGQRYFQLVEKLEALLATADLSKTGKKAAGTVIPALVKKDVKRLHAAVVQARDNPAGTGDHPALHEARKDGKRLRYAAEAASAVFPKRASHIVDAAHDVQKVLGDHQDSIVTRTVLRRLGSQAFLQGENGFSYGRLHALEEAAALETERRFHAEWKKFPSLSLTK
ncbi:CYTH and CHAD domain-containing protein [Pseudarthrobacter sp. NPDC080039]|uniref:CYTH and CHAD domain-containing protein n=1 Tax=unclassified Pseudarthrobacter TaxID=2647000 RepID=UPI0034500E41